MYPASFLHPLNQKLKGYTAKLQFFLCFPTYPFWFCSRIFAAFQSCKRHLNAGKPSDSDLAVVAQHFGPAARAACRMTSQVAAHHPLETWRPWQVTAIQNGGSSLLGSKPVWQAVEIWGQTFETVDAGYIFQSSFSFFFRKGKICVKIGLQQQQSFLWPEDVEEHEELVSELLGIWDAQVGKMVARSTPTVRFFSPKFFNNCQPGWFPKHGGDWVIRFRTSRFLCGNSLTFPPSSNLM